MHDMHNFLRRRTPYTVLPPPLPDDRTSALNSFYFPDSPTQDALAIMDACLHNLYDVPRAKQVFHRLRESKIGDPALEARLYNSFLEAYVEMATTKEANKRVKWVEELLELFNAMESGREKVEPTASTYAVMLIAWMRFNPDTPTHPLPDPSALPALPNPKYLLTSITDRSIPITAVASDRAFSASLHSTPDSASAESSAAIKVLSKAAVELGLSSVVSQLGAAEVLGCKDAYEDPLEDVPEVLPVLKELKVSGCLQESFIRAYTQPSEPTPASDTPTSDPTTSTTPQPTHEVPFNLHTLRKHLTHLSLARRVLPDDAIARQKLLEESVYDVAVARLKHQAERFDEMGFGAAVQGLQRPELQKWMWEWHGRLRKRLEEEVRSVVEYEAGNNRLHHTTRLGPFLSLVKPERLSLITILEIMRLQGTGGVADGMKTARALLTVGKAVETEYKAEMCRRNGIVVVGGEGWEAAGVFGGVGHLNSNPGSGSGSGSGLDEGGGIGISTSPPPHSPRHQTPFTRFGYRALHARRVAACKYMEDAEEWTSTWTQVLRVRVGSILVDCLMDVACVERVGVGRDGVEIKETQPAFFHSYEYIRGQKLGVIRLNPVVSDRIAKDGLRETLHPRHLPMLVKPKPWLSHDQGGYLFSKTSAMRFKDSQEQLSYLKHASSLGNVELVYAGLDVLGSTPWRINRPVFDVVLKVWNSGERVCKIPPAVYDVPEPERVSGEEGGDQKARSVWMQRMKAWVQNRANNHSERCSVNYKMEIARAFLGDTLYLPHNIDFRGRAYPIPPHLNHIGDDLSRGLLKFAEARPLGARGLRWLKIHLANLYGFDKGSFDEREEFVMRNIEEVYDSAMRPLEGNRWWQKADDPWQCLSTCMELRAALESPDPLTFESALPVHQDGTCNGLQHYAALGGDAQGARQVNLGVTDRPSDVYTYVADMVVAMIEADCAKGDRVAMLLRGKIARKVVKQTVMTTVYGVTFVGARDQIEKQLKDRGDIPEEECWGAAAYVAKKTLSCIGDLFTGAKHIQNWLNTSARLISKSIPPDRLPDALTDHAPNNRLKRKVLPANRLKKEQMTSVVWTTPLGLPIVQPYRKTKRKQIKTSLQTVYLSDPNSPAEVNTMKQASAFPPNFIHSLDATHMMLTALECRTQGLTFASVHDSYWTHASSIDKMSEIIRDTFIALHSSDVLGKLQTEFHERYKGYKVPLNNIRMGQMIKQLRQAGTSVSVTKEQAVAMEPIQALLHVKPDGLIEPSADHEQVDVEAAVSADQLETEEAEEADDENVDETEKADAPSGEDEPLGKFLELTDLLPPLPKKGTFDVETIKRSQYFFS